MGHDEEAQPSVVIISIGESAESRLLIELSSYGSDLAEAREALDLAVQGFEEGSVLADASRHLVGLAVIAYCRTVLHSNVRGRLTDHVAVPDELVDVHHQVSPTGTPLSPTRSPSSRSRTQSASSTQTPSKCEMSLG